MNPDPTTGCATALVLREPRVLQEIQLPVPDPGPDGAILRVEACGLCGTDHEQYSGHLPAGFAFVPGHETVGVIEAIGPRAVSLFGVGVGDRVAVEVFQSCRSCDRCSDGRYRQCRKHGMADMYGFTPLETNPGLWGGYATHQYLSPDSMVLPVPTSLDPVMATLFNPVGAGIRWAVDVPGTSVGDTVVIMGPGIRGLAAAAAARDAGAGFVMVTGLGERDAPRLAAATDFGADLAVDVATHDPVQALREAAGGLADVVVDVTAKAPAALGQAIDLARAGGTVVLAGTRGTDATPGFWPDTIVYKELRILGALGVEVTAYQRALDLIASGNYPFAELARRTVGFDGLPALLATLAGETDETPPVHGVFVPDRNEVH